MSVGQLLRGVPAGIYHRDLVDEWAIDPDVNESLNLRPRLSQSMAALLLNECAAVAYDAHPKLGGHPPAPTREMEMGSLLHGLVLEDRVPPEYEVVRVGWVVGKKDKRQAVPLGTPDCEPGDALDYRPDAAQEARDAIRVAGRVPILTRELQEAQETAKRVREAVDVATGGAISHSEAELVALWEEEGVACKARLDLVTRSSRWVCWDLKFVRSAHPQRWGRGMVAAGYDIQQAAYRSALETIYPELQGRVHFQFVLVQLEPLLLVTLPTLAGSTIEHGEKRWKRALKMWKRCLETNDWPEFDDSEPIELPTYQLADEAYRQLAEEEL